MAVLSKEDRLALLAQSTYGKGQAGTKSRSTGFRQVNTKTLGDQQQKSGSVSVGYLREVTAQPVSRIENNPHWQEIKRLEAKPELMAKDREHYEQTLFFAQVLDKYPEYYGLLSAVPNGGFRRKAERWRLCAEGQKAGWPDTQFMKPSLGFHALFIEFKKPFECFKNIGDARRSVKSHQVATLRMLISQGYAAKVAFGAREAFEIFEAYIGVKGDFGNVILFYPPELLKPPIEGETLELHRNSFEVLEAEYA
ncbi:hypothetical protein AB6D66_01790 [Vibrio pomeroyi]|uniref:VRR-NUC domain-containing protein n=1 Tax=Vibrio pomeroyi TaxID=198832 RepID=A0ABV4MRQ7_9VIBR|nr:hypothetical protein [Vibrio atlanticus]MCZ4310145.1 hypothetical protein [Vibrio atlanticus]